MAPKTHRLAPSLSRHSRTTSGGSSKVGLNLHFTQKDPVTSQGVKKARGNGHGRHESMYSTGTDSDPHLQSKEAGQQTQTSRVVSNPTQRPHGSKKPDFTIASEGDDDEWVSSESGPVTPSNLSDDGALISPLEPPTPVEFPSFVPAVPIDKVLMKGNGNEVAGTPRAGLPPHSRHHPSLLYPEASATPPARPTPMAQISQIAAPLQEKPQFQKTELPLHFEVKQCLDRDQKMIEVQTIPGKQPTIKQIRSEASSPLSPHHHSRTNSAARQSFTRPPSLYSINAKSDVSLRPHPLIRGQSMGFGVATTPKPVPLAPLTTIPSKSTLGISNISSSPPVASPGLSQRSASPAPSLRTSISVPDDYASSEARKQLRRQSTSSQASIATIPTAPPKSAHDRQGTTSNMSTSSSLLSSFTHPNRHNSPTRSPAPGFTSHFPPGDETSDVSELIHSLLPPPYLSAHLTVLAHRSPIMESYYRVIRAKRQQR